MLNETGFEITDVNKRIKRTGVAVNFIAVDQEGFAWYFDVSGAFTTHRGGLLRTDTVWKSLGRAHALREHLPEDTHLVFLTTNLPRRPSEGDTALRAAGPNAFFDAVDMLSEDGLERLRQYSEGKTREPLPGFWTPGDLGRRGR